MSQKLFEAIMLDILAMLFPYLFISLINWSLNIFTWPDYWYGIWAILYFQIKNGVYSKSVYTNIREYWPL